MRGFSVPFRDAGRGGRRPVLALLALVALLAQLATSAAAEPEGGVAGGDLRLLEPIRESLGASSWMMASGYDPRLANIPVGGEARGDAAFDMLPGAAAAPRAGAAFQPLVPFRSAAPAFSRNQIVTRQVGLFPIQTEPHIAVNPLDPEHLVLGTIDYNFPSMSSYVSFDGGETWDGPNQVRYFQEDFSAAGDPVIAFDRDGAVYMTSISLGFEEFRLGSLFSATEVSSMVVSKSTDDGLTWSDAVSTARSTVQTVSQPDPEGQERGTLTSQFLDKPWIAIGPNPADPEKDVIYLTYTEFATTYGLVYADEVPFLTSPFTETTIRMIYSDDGGATWSQPAPVSPTVLQAEGASEPGEGEGEGRAAQTAQDDDGEGGGGRTQEQNEGPGGEANQTVQGSQPAVMPDGTLVMTYLDTTNDGVQEGLYKIMAVTSADGGRTLSEPVQAGVFREIHFTPRSSTFRYWGAAFPQIAVGPNDDVYIATTARPADKPTDDGDIYVMRSMDKGQTWDPEPLRINQDDTDRVQFFPSIDVSEDGVLHAMWGDMREDPEEARYHIYYTRSSDQGETFGFENPDIGLNVPDTRVTDFPSNSLRGFPGGRFLGDYFSLTANEDDVYMVWADTRLGEFGGPNQQIGFARETQIEPPSLFLNPPSGVAGRDVAIQGLNFQPNANISIDVGGVPLINLRTDEKGQFTTNVYMPVTGEGPRNVTAYDETGNVGSASFFTEFGFDSIARELDEVRDQVGLPPDAAVPAATPSAAPAATPVAEPASAVPTPAPLPVPPVVEDAA